MKGISGIHRNQGNKRFEYKPTNQPFLPSCNHKQNFFGHMSGIQADGFVVFVIPLDKVTLGLKKLFVSCNPTLTSFYSKESLP